MCSNEGVKEESGSASSKREEKVGLVQLGTRSIRVYELGSNKIVMGNAKS